MKSFFYSILFFFFISGITFPVFGYAATETEQTIPPAVEQLKKRASDFLDANFSEPQRKTYTQPLNEMRSDIVEKDGAFYILSDLPGMRKDQINIEVKGQEVLISGERKVEKEFKTSNLLKVERRYGSFERVYTIPEEFVAEQISAKYENGVLEVKIPRKNAAAAAPSKTITVS